MTICAWAALAIRLQLRQSNALLTLILAFLVLVRHLRGLRPLEEQHLSDAFVRIDLRRQRRRVRDLESDEPFPLRLERRHVCDDAATGVRGLADADRNYIARNAKVLDGSGQGERVRRDDADIAVELDERPRVEIFGVDDRIQHIREDPEFACYGPIGFDLGAFFGNLLLSWYSQPGHATSNDDRLAYQDWILDQARTFWETFRSRFLALWAGHARGDAWPAAMFCAAADSPALESARNAFLNSLFADMLGFAACKMIRRILGFAHVIDFERIPDAALRGCCEADALALAHLLLTHPEQFTSVDDVLDAVPRIGTRR